MILLFFLISIISTAYLACQYSKIKQQNSNNQLKIVPTEMPPSPTPDPAVDWQIYTNEEHGLSVNHPAGTVVEELAPGSVTFCSTSLPDCIVQERVFLANVRRTKNRDAHVLSLKLVRKPSGMSLYAAVEYFSQECLGAMISPLEQVKLSNKLTGYKYSCQGMGPITYLWAAVEDRPDILFVASWFGEDTSLAEQVVSTVQLK
ncbi:MAG: hypothetical protein HQ595_04155 [Candidatus Omnitrophica bacterium]|nr:hypothetical protein [Candidatus Omnitrophota bacterium]